MLKPKDSVRLKVQYRPEEFTKVKGLPGDSFYIRYQGLGVPGIRGQGRGFLRRLVLVSVSATERVRPWSLLHGPQATCSQRDACDLGKLHLRTCRTT